MATINDILTYVDEVKPNQYDDFVKMKFVSDLEKNIYNDIVKNHLPNEYEEFVEPPEVPSMSDELIAKSPYDNVYNYYVMAQIDFLNNETERYANTMAMFNNEYNNFANNFNRTHKPINNWLKL